MLQKLSFLFIGKMEADTGSACGPERRSDGAELSFSTTSRGKGEEQRFAAFRLI